MARRQHLSTAVRSQRKGVVQKGWRSARASWRRNRRAEITAVQRKFCDAVT